MPQGTAEILPSTLGTSPGLQELSVWIPSTWATEESKRNCSPFRRPGTTQEIKVNSYSERQKNNFKQHLCSHLGNNKLIKRARIDYSRTSSLKAFLISLLVRVTSQVDKEEAADVIFLEFIKNMKLSCVTFSLQRGKYSQESELIKPVDDSVSRTVPSTLGDRMGCVWISWRNKIK